MPSGVDTIFNNISRLTPVIRKRAKDVANAAAHQCEALAKVNAPVDTGALRSEIHVEVMSDIESDVVSSMEYSIDQEYGTHKMAAHPYMTPAAEAVRPRFLSDMRQVAEEAARGN